MTLFWSISPVNDYEKGASKEDIRASIEDDMGSNFVSAATGSRFTGNRIRTFSKFVFRQKGIDNPLGARDDKTLNAGHVSHVGHEGHVGHAGNVVQDVHVEHGAACDNWGVMTTINSPPTEAVRRFLYKPDWCIVVVSDLNKPKVGRRFLQ